MIRSVRSALAAVLLTQCGMAAAYPDKPVRVFVGLAPGGGTDITARILMQKLAETMNQSFIVDNRPGAGSMLACALAAQASPDGYTLIFVSPEFAVNPSLQRQVPYDAVRDFAPVIQAVYGQYFLSVRGTLAAHNVRELVTMAKAAPKPLTYASSGNGSANHLAGELFKTMAGVSMVHVPYRGSGPAVSALLAQEVDVLFSSTTAVQQHIRSGRIRALAVTGPKRAAIAPDIPTVSEAGIQGYQVTGWYGLLAPARTPRAIIHQLNVEANRVLPALKERYAELGTDLVGGSPEQFGALIRTELDKWAKVVKASGAKPD